MLAASLLPRAVQKADTEAEREPDSNGNRRVCGDSGGRGRKREVVRHRRAHEAAEQKDSRIAIALAAKDELPPRAAAAKPKTQPGEQHSKKVP